VGVLSSFTVNGMLLLYWSTYAADWAEDAKMGSRGVGDTNTQKVDYGGYATAAPCVCVCVCVCSSLGTIIDNNPTFMILSAIHHDQHPHCVSENRKKNTLET